MNRERAKELLPIIEAFADGADVQIKVGERGWSDQNSPDFSLANEWRIKPREFWVADPSGFPADQLPWSECEMEDGLKWIKVVEVIGD